MKVEQHYPRVEITTPASNIRHPVVGVLTLVRVDGLLWPVTGYRVEANVDGAQEIMLTFIGDVTIVHPEPVT